MAPTSSHRVLGLDPGIRRHNPMGAALLRPTRGKEWTGSGWAVEASYLLAPDEKTLPEMIDRIGWLGATLYGLIKKVKPTMVVYELPFIGKNKQTGLDLAHVGGAICTAATLAGVPVVGYSPREVKAALTGSGGAEKEAMITYAQHLFGFDLSAFKAYFFVQPPHQRVGVDCRSHIADACGIAWTAVQHRNLSARGA